MNVFISYAHTDRSLAIKVSEALIQAGFKVWDYEEEILPGDNWAEKIAQGLEEADAMVVLITPEAMRSLAVRREIDYALGKKIFKDRLIPVLVGTLGNEDIPWILRHLNTIKLSEPEEEEEIKRITEVLQAVA